ncbi:hypothetical protein AAFF_G00038890 [Aldrovandia affinis]|uniref:Uncharacterized protein n=1 Tax=Aldrovandia affinis TaxID=143900 RepID=A0AAD7WZ88_9TELE|nr:hypothetical protein AAFF_G00038890 [Aldrovandia affinis]
MCSLRRRQAGGGVSQWRTCQCVRKQLHKVGRLQQWPDEATQDWRTDLLNRPVSADNHHRCAGGHILICIGRALTLCLRDSSSLCTMAGLACRTRRNDRISEF